MLRHKVEIINPLKLEDNESTLGQQQDTVIQMLDQMIATITQSNDGLDTKAGILLQSSSIIIGLIGVLRIPNYVTSNPPFWVQVGIAIAFIIFLIMLGLSMWAWQPHKMYIPGSTEWDKLYLNYIQPDVDEMRQRMISDRLTTVERLRELNKIKSDTITWSAGLLMVQIIGLLVIALFG